MISSGAVRKAGPFIGDGVQTVFPFTFKVFAAADLLVVLTDLTPADATQVLTSDYTVSLNADQDNSPGGSVTMVVPPPTDYLLTIGSAMPETQTMVLTNTGGFFPTVINNMADRITIIAQQLSEKLGRSLTLPFSSTASIELPPAVANNFLGWNSAANAIINYAGVVGVAVSGFMETVIAAADAAAARAAISAAKSGANTDITSITGSAASAGLPWVSKSTAYTTVLADANKGIFHPSTDNNARIFTIDSNANVPYDLGTTLVFANKINTVTIAITSDTLTWAGVGTAGSRSLAANGMATALKVSTTEWLISGQGLT